MNKPLHLAAALAAAASIFGTATLAPTSAKAGVDPFIGELMLVGYNFCPRGWTNADGQLLAISQFSALFSLYGTMYGGDGRTTFGLPDLRGRSAVHVGNGPGLPSVSQGSKQGNTQFTISTSQMPSHNHPLIADEETASTAAPNNAFLAEGTTSYRVTPIESPVNMAAGSIGNTGGGAAINKRSPMQVLRWCVALQGTFPSRN